MITSSPSITSRLGELRSRQVDTDAAILRYPSRIRSITQSSCVGTTALSSQDSCGSKTRGGSESPASAFGPDDQNDRFDLDGGQRRAIAMATKGWR